MTDILSAVYDYVLKYACDVSNDINPYTENQIVRGWQNSATLPPNTNEFCIITDLTTSAHGTTPEFFDSDNVCQLQRTIEHVIQLDFLSSEVQQLYKQYQTLILQQTSFKLLIRH